MEIQVSDRTLKCACTALAVLARKDIRDLCCLCVPAYGALTLTGCFLDLLLMSDHSVSLVTADNHMRCALGCCWRYVYATVWRGSYHGAFDTALVRTGSIIMEL